MRLKDTLRVRFKKIPWRAVLLTITLLFVAFSLYVFSLYADLEKAFESTAGFVPTRMFSDVTRIAPPQSRRYVEARLKSLGYTATSSGENLRFNLRDVSYPEELLPPGHATFLLKGKEIRLIFDGPDADALLQQVQSSDPEHEELTEVYLEPELVATFSRPQRDEIETDTDGTVTLQKEQNEVREHLKFPEIPSEVWKAIIAIEDQHFLEHRGFDPKGLTRAMLVNLRHLSFKQGGSTLTQQLVKNLSARHNKNLFRKISELFLAIILELRYEKEEILERYLNEVWLGQIGNLEIHGVGEGAKYFFGKRVEDLNLGEIAMMAGLIRGPIYYSPYKHLDRAVERQQLVLSKMVETNKISQAEATKALKLPLRIAPPPSGHNKAPYYTDYAKAQVLEKLKDRMNEAEVAEAGFRIYTALDTTMNSAAQQSVEEGVLRLEKSIPGVELQGALASVDHRNGNIRVLVGGKNYKISTFNRILNMKRQVGSTFKPVVYLSALLKGKDQNGVSYGPAYPLEDTPWTLTYDRGKQSWSPKNYTKEYRGWTDFRTSLAFSINVSTARLGVEIGFESIAETARMLGIVTPVPLLPSTSLGVVELSPVELLKAYATLANHGARDELTVIRTITQDDGTGFAHFELTPQQYISPPAADLMTDLLQSVFSEGTAKDAFALGFDRPAAGKTGTTSNHRDAWFAGYTPDLTTVVWVGMDRTDDEKIAKKVHLTGAGSALPIWVSYMKEVLDSMAPVPFVQNSNLVNVRMDIRSGKKATAECPDSQVKVERYLPEFAPTDESCESTFPPSHSEFIAEHF